MKISGIRQLIAPTIASVVAFAILINFGLWQLERKTWKENLIQTLIDRRNAPPMDLPSAEKWLAEQVEYFKVQVKGKFLNQLEARIHGLYKERSQTLQGYYIITPLQIQDSKDIILVNRGFVPAGKDYDKPENTVFITGSLRASEQKPYFVPDNNPEKDKWFTRDIDAIAKARGNLNVLPFLIEVNEDASLQWPRGRSANVELSNNHLQYALTWFGIALTLIGVFGVYVSRFVK